MLALKIAGDEPSMDCSLIAYSLRRPRERPNYAKVRSDLMRPHHSIVVLGLSKLYRCRYIRLRWKPKNGNHGPITHSGQYDNPHALVLRAN